MNRGNINIMQQLKVMLLVLILNIFRMSDCQPLLRQGLSLKAMKAIWFSSKLKKEQLKA